MRIIIFILSVLLFFSCVNNVKIKEDLEQLQSRGIEIPTTDMIFLTKGKDTIINGFMDSELKLIIYSDSIGCSPCSIKYMYEWEDLLEYAKQFNDGLKYYFIFSPKKNDEYSVRFALRSALFDYPVILDSKYEFAKLNPHLPENKAMHTFLLDRDNNVILVGSPLNNPKIERLFKTTVENLLSDKKGS